MEAGTMTVNDAVITEIRNVMQDKTEECVDDFNTLQKIQKAKMQLGNMEIKMTGKNTFNKYNYFELKDITKPIMQVLHDNELCSRFLFHEDKAILRIYSETGYCQWQTPLRRVEQTGSSKDIGVYMKSEQAIQTYARRTLWLQAMEIEENNTIEMEAPAEKQSQPQTKPKQKQKQKQKPVKKTPPTMKGEPVVNQTTLNTTPTKQVTPERIKEITAKAYNYFIENYKGEKPFSWENASFCFKKFCNAEELEAVKNSVTSKPATEV